MDAGKGFSSVFLYSWKSCFNILSYCFLITALCVRLCIFFKHFETLWLLLLQIWTHFMMLISSETLGDTFHLAIEILQRSSFWFYFHSYRLYLLCLWCRHLLWLLHKHLHRDKSQISLFDHWLLILMNISVLSQSSQIKIRSSQ